MDFHSSMHVSLGAVGIETKKHIKKDSQIRTCIRTSLHTFDCIMPERKEEEKD
jgi:hypothetical protein